MFFLIRLVFWLTVIFALVPVFLSGNDPKADNASAKFSAGDAVTAATATMSDLSQFCSRRPDACAAGAQAAAAIGVNAQAGVKIIYGILQEKMSEDAATAAHADKPAATSRKPAKDRSASDRSPTGTVSSKSGYDSLGPADLAPAWRGPA